MAKAKSSTRQGKFIAPRLLAQQRDIAKKSTHNVKGSSNLLAGNQNPQQIMHQTSNGSTSLVMHYCKKEYIVNDFDEESTYLDILKACKRCLDIYSVQFKITTNDGLRLKDDGDISLMMMDNVGRLEIHVTIEEDKTVPLLSYKLPEDNPLYASSISISPNPKVTSLRIIGDLKVNEKVTVSGDVTGGSVEASIIQMFITISKNFGVETDLQTISLSQSDKVFLIPLEALNHYLVAKYTPKAGDGKIGDSVYVISEKHIENSTTQKKNKGRGTNLNKKVAALKSGQKIEIKFYNNRGVAVNHACWSRHLGKIVRDANICPVRVQTWRSMTTEAKEHMWLAVKECFQSKDIEIYRKHTLAHMGTLWTSWRSDMYDKFVVPSKTQAEALKKLAPHMTVENWTWLVNNKFYTKAFLKRRAQSILNRAKAVMHHKSGSKPHREIIYEMGGKDGNQPAFIDIFFATRQKDGKLQDEESKKKYDEIAKTIQSEPSIPDIEVIDKCFGPQTHNHVFAYGGGMQRKDVIGSKSTREKELEREVQEKEEENCNLKRRLDEFEDWKKSMTAKFDQMQNGGVQQSSVLSPTNP